MGEGCFTQDRQSRQEPGNAGTGVAGSSGKMAPAAPCSGFQGLEEERKKERKTKDLNAEEVEEMADEGLKWQEQRLQGSTFGTARKRKTLPIFTSKTTKVSMCGHQQCPRKELMTRDRA